MKNNVFRKLIVFTRRKYRILFKSYYSKKDIESLNNREFVIISNNCWGGEIYNWYNKPYNTPFIGLFFYSPCFIKLASDFDNYMSKELKFIEKSKYLNEKQDYPIGLIEDAEIHFLHYETEEEANQKWNRRKERMLKVNDKNSYFFKLCDTNHTTEKNLKEFHQLPHKNKVSFSVKRFKSLENYNHIIIKESQKNQKQNVPNGVKLYKLTFLYFNIHKWLMN